MINIIPMVLEGVLLVLMNIINYIINLSTHSLSFKNNKLNNKFYDQ